MFASGHTAILMLVTISRDLNDVNNSPEKRWEFLPRELIKSDGRSRKHKIASAKIPERTKRILTSCNCKQMKKLSLHYRKYTAGNVCDRRLS